MGSCRYVCNFFSEREIAPVHVFLIFKQAPVFRWGGRMSHPPGWREKRQDCRFYGTVLRGRTAKGVGTAKGISPIFLVFQASTRVSVGRADVPIRRGRPEGKATGLSASTARFYGDATGVASLHLPKSMSFRLLALLRG